jgi:hypothetical protein
MLEKAFIKITNFLNTKDMKKIFIFVAACMMTALVGCGQKTASSENADSTAVDSTVVDSTAVDSAVVDSAVVDSTICNE